MNTQRDYQPYLAGAFRWRLALRPLDLANWIEIGDDYDHEMDAKKSVFAENFSTANAFQPNTEDESAEVLAELIEHLVTTRPDWFAREGRDIVNHHRHERFAVEPNSDGQWDEHPLVTCARLVQEDFALLVERDSRLIFGGGSVCFPNRWDLNSKLGLTMSEVHAPVDQLNDQLQDPLTVLAHTESGVLMTVDIAANSTYGYEVRMEALMENGSLEIDNLGGVSISYDFNLPPRTHGKLYENWMGRFEQAYINELTAWVGSIKSGVRHPDLATANDGLASSISCEMGVASLK